MKINLLENLRVDDTYIEELAQKLKEAGRGMTLLIIKTGPRIQMNSSPVARMLILSLSATPLIRQK
ncbi:hypothetical protein [Aerococcus sanguinicola]|uniref:hypothetical protein n=1 Tax=Aerococcus sanguinicola TaxID=119206 RepID=UPI002DDA5253|nr:hypothetical protein [Aerococcus sanguinicola]